MSPELPSARWLVGSADSDPLVGDPGPLAEIDDWRTTLMMSDGEDAVIRQHTRTGRPMGDESFVTYVESMLGRMLRKRKPGPASKR